MGVRQVDVEVRSGDDVCRAWFFFPVAGNESSACIVMGHGLGLTRNCGLREIAVAFAAANDEGVAGVVAVVPMFDGLGSTLAAMKRWSPLNFLRIIARATNDLLGSLFDRSPTLVPLTAPPGALGLLTSPDAHPGYRALVPSDFNYDTAARIGLLFWSYFPGLRLRRFSRPILILSSSVDRINPPGPTRRHASKCKSATIIELDCEHLEAVIEPTRSRVVHATLDFLHQRAPSRQVQ